MDQTELLHPTIRDPEAFQEFAEALADQVPSI